MTNSEILQGLYDAQAKILKGMPLQGTPEWDALSIIDALIERFQ